VDDEVMVDHQRAGTTPTRAELLSIVERSPAAAGAHDRDAWVGLFTPGGRVEDPVGSRPHRGRAAIERFYDTFIGPRDITFHRATDVVVGSTVVRGLELEVSMADSLVLRIPTYLRYDVEYGTGVPADGELRIARLQAHWELPAMVMQFARSGVGARGKRHLAGFLDDACAGDEVAVRRRLSDRVLVSLGDDDRPATSELVSRLAGGRPRKLIASGHTVAAGIESNGGRQVLIADLRSGPLAITRIRLFVPGGLEQ
jgi:hypothetical protein